MNDLDTLSTFGNLSGATPPMSIAPPSAPAAPTGGNAGQGPNYNALMASVLKMLGPQQQQAPQMPQISYFRPGMPPPQMAPMTMPQSSQQPGLLGMLGMFGGQK